MYAYDLLQNPFRYKHKLVELDTMSIPWIANGNLVKVQRYATEDRKVLGIYAVRFKKMVAEHEAIYDILIWDMGNPIHAEGSLVVLLPAEMDGDLDRERHWMIQPLGTITGTNGFGAETTVPLVRFWKYAQDDLSAPTSLAEVGRLTTEAKSGKVNAQIRLGIAYATGNVVTQDLCESAKWFRKAGKQGEKGLAYLQSHFDFRPPATGPGSCPVEP